jgi:hypothetical protein
MREKKKKNTFLDTGRLHMLNLNQINFMRKEEKKRNKWSRKRDLPPLRSEPSPPACWYTKGVNIC